MNKKSHQLGEKEFKRIRIICGALIGLNVISLLQIIETGMLDFELALATYCLAVSIPFLTTLILINMIRTNSDLTCIIWYEYWLISIGLLSSIISYGCLFWHLSPYIGISFIASTVLTFLFLIHFAKKHM